MIGFIFCNLGDILGVIEGCIFLVFFLYKIYIILESMYVMK